MFKKLSILFSFLLFLFIYLNLQSKVFAVGTCVSQGGECADNSCPSSGFTQVQSSDCGTSGAIIVCCVPNAAPTPTSTPTPTPTATPTLAPGAPTATPTTAGAVSGASGTITPTPQWIPDPEVTFVGKNAARAGLLLNWALDASNFQWVYLPINTTTNKTEQNPLLPFWTTIFRIVGSLLLLLVLGTAFILIATRGRSITIKRFIPRFILIVLLVFFSFSILQFIYQIADVIQLFFLRSPTYSTPTSVVNISQKDLLSVAIDYSTFQGFRLSGDGNTESAFMSLLLLKFTTITYYVMVGVLILRKIILWFFIILSPIFPLLLLYKPVRNTGKIWIGEFFRWVLYAPLFSIFLAGLVSLWTTAIPLNFLATVTTDNFPTAINIELGAPGQKVDLTHSVSNIGTFAEYAIALLMLWVVILLPFILLQMLLNYMNTISFKETPWMQQLISRSPTFFKPPPTSPLPSSPPPERYQSTGLAKSLPYDNAISLQRRSTTDVSPKTPEKMDVEILQLTNLSVPTMRDIARFETDHLSATNSSQKQEVSRMQESLAHVANPQGLVHARLQQESQKGNILAKNILNAASSVSRRSNLASAQQVMTAISNPGFASSSLQRDKATALRQIIMQESEKGNPTATAFIASMNGLNKTELSNIGQVLQNLAHPDSIQNIAQQQTFARFFAALTQESQTNNPLAMSMLTVIKTMSTNTKGADIATVTKLREQLREESQKGNKLANDFLALTDTTKVINDVQTLLRKLVVAEQKGDQLATKILALFAENGVQAKSSVATLPLANRIQTVSIEDYEAVKKMWIENYQKMDIPQNLEGSIKDRRSWITTDRDNINETIALLSSMNQEKIDEGMQHVSNILPFLLIGGFSQTEIIAYLKAKLQAGKEVLEQLQHNDEEEETMMDKRAGNKSQTINASEHMAVEVPENPVLPEQRPLMQTVSPTPLTPQDDTKKT